MALVGDLGTGKTRFVTGVCDGLSVQQRATSPTFTFVNEYHAPLGAVVHIDLYRVRSPAEVEELGVEEYFTDSTICLIEWAENILGRLPRRHHLVRFRFGDHENEREITIEEVAGP